MPERENPVLLRTERCLRTRTHLTQDPHRAELIHLERLVVLADAMGSIENRAPVRDQNPQIPTIHNGDVPMMPTSAHTTSKKRLKNLYILTTRICLQLGQICPQLGQIRFS